ncbi:2Fe-2S iron-sulfur cluster-binding protein [Nannocystis sp. RBIL2]|nr:2Fe-2S iron-sulfur cluster-binding protein [Nannocystis sp. RBIL2]
MALGRTWETEVPVGSTLLPAAKSVGAPEGDVCGGVCACSTCHVYVTKGRELLSEDEEDEEDILDKAFDVRASSRLGCQARIQKDGDIEAEISRESLDAFYHEHPGREGPPQGSSARHLPLRSYRAGSSTQVPLRCSSTDACARSGAAASDFVASTCSNHRLAAARSP